MGENELVEPEPLGETAVSPVATTGYEVYDDESGDMTAVPEAVGVWEGGGGFIGNLLTLFPTSRVYRKKAMICLSQASPK